MSSIYLACGNPPQGQLSPAQVLNSVNQWIRHYHAEMALTDEMWNVDKFPLNVVAGREEYQLDDLDMGRPFLVETFDPANPYATRRPVEMTRPQDRTLFGGGGSVSFSLNGSGGINKITFFNVGQPAGASCQISPVPRTNFQLRVWHEAMATTDKSIKELPTFLLNFLPLIESSCQADLLPYCGYQGDDLNIKVQRADASKLQRYEVFQRYIQQSYHSRVTSSRSSCSSRRGRGIGY